MKEQESDFVVRAMYDQKCTECKGDIKTGEYLHRKGNKKLCVKCEGI